LAAAGISLHARLPRGSFCLVEGLVEIVDADLHRPFGGIIVKGLFSARSHSDGFYRTAIPRGNHTLTVLQNGKVIGSQQVNCNPDTEPVITQDLSSSGTLTDEPYLLVTITDPAGDIDLPEGSTSYNVVGTSTAPFVDVIVRNVVSADPAFRNRVPVGTVLGPWSQTVILGPGLNTVIARVGGTIDGTQYSPRQVSRIIKVPGDPGGLKFTLTWETDATDIDLHVVTPSSSEIFYGNTSADGGVLDVDDVNGRGPENVTFATAANGTYAFSAVYFSGSGATPVTILVIHNGRLVGTFSDTLSAPGDTFSAGTITLPEGRLGR
jgi:hypothetical protein